MKKISILGLHLGFGGVEQAIINLANCLCEDFEVHLVIVYKTLDHPAFNVDSKVKIDYLTELKPNKKEFVESLKQKRIFKAFVEGIKALRILHLRKSVVKKYVKSTDSDVIVSSRILFTKILNKYSNNNTINIAQEHCHHNNNKRYINALKKSVARIDFLMPVSKELTKYYGDIIDNGRTKCVYIPHCLNYFPQNKNDLNTKNIISVGRLSPEKGYLDLIDVFKLFSDKHPQWKLNIVGDGEEYNLIREKIKSFNLDNKIIMHGFLEQKQLHEVFKESSIYVMASETESFGLVLIEAMSFGIPCVSFSSAQGAKEIIEDNVNGYLISNRNKEFMVEKIDRLVKDNCLRQKLGVNARNSIKKYKYDNIKSECVKFFYEVINEKNI